MSIDRQFFIQLQGRDFVLFAGLLDGATKAGLKSIVTTPVQIASAENGRMAVMKARVEFEDGRVFEAIGDASPESCGRMIHPHVQRMAETRAVGRAFRWALNVSVAMKEELGGDDEEAPSTPRQPAPSRAQGTSAPPASSGGTLVCSAEGCGALLTKGQYEISMRKLGEARCPAHQKTVAA